MKKIIVAMFLASVLFVCTACGGEKVDEETANHYINKAEEVVFFLHEGNYKEITEQFDEVMKTELSEEQLKEVELFLQQSGAFESFSKSSVEKVEGLYVVVLVGNYAEDKRIFTISFNDNDEISGLFVK